MSHRNVEIDACGAPLSQRLLSQAIADAYASGPEELVTITIKRVSRGPWSPGVPHVYLAYMLPELFVAVTTMAKTAPAPENGRDD